MMTLEEAQRILAGHGLVLNYVGGDSHYREYWWFGDGLDSLLDHSATITVIDGVAHISDFRKKIAPRSDVERDSRQPRHRIHRVGDKIELISSQGESPLRSMTWADYFELGR